MADKIIINKRDFNIILKHIIVAKGHFIHNPEMWHEGMDALNRAHRKINAVNIRELFNDQ